MFLSHIPLSFWREPLMHRTKKRKSTSFPMISTLFPLTEDLKIQYVTPRFCSALRSCCFICSSLHSAVSVCRPLCGRIHVKKKHLPLLTRTVGWTENIFSCAWVPGSLSLNVWAWDVTPTQWQTMFPYCVLWGSKSMEIRHTNFLCPSATSHPLYVTTNSVEKKV